MPQLFTSENAVEMGRKGAQERWRKEAERKAQAESDNQAEKAAISTEVIAADVFRTEAVLCARTHIRRLQARIDDELDRRELDTKAMRELADTVMKLEVVEQKLSNRPAPAAAKVSSKPPRRSTEFPSPTPIAE